MKALKSGILTLLLVVGASSSANESKLNFILNYDMSHERGGDTREQIGTAVIEYKVTEGLYFKTGYGYTKIETPYGATEVDGYIVGLEMIIPLGK